MEASELYARIKAEVESVLNAVVVEALSEPPVVSGGPLENPPVTTDGSDSVRASAWNLERGIRFDGILDALKRHEQIKDKDILLLTELDYGMARSGNRFVAQELARELKLNYAFAPV